MLALQNVLNTEQFLVYTLLNTYDVIWTLFDVILQIQHSR